MQAMQTMQECRNAGMQECRNAGMRECRNDGSGEIFVIFDPGDITNHSFMFIFRYLMIYG